MAQNEGMDVLKKRGYGVFVKLDSGGQANVYKTTKDKITYAAKVVRIPEDMNKELTDDLQRELTIIKKVKHPNCIGVEDLFRTKHKVYIIMDFMPNKSILDEVERRGKAKPICEWKAKLWFSQTANAIRYLHKHKIAHRDLKLENILLDAHMNPKVADFGFSNFVAMDPQTGKTKKSKTFVGTPNYEPPELVMTTPYDPYKCDVWCLGVCLFVMLNYEYPFDTSEPKEKFYEKQIKKLYKFEPNVGPKLSNEVKNLINLLLEPNGEKRINITQVCKNAWIPNNFHDLDY